jgi:6-phosphofructokinase 1
MDTHGRRHYGGIGETVARAIEAGTDGRVEARATVLGHLQRGGEPSAYDTILATAFGTHAVDLVAEGRFDTMVALDGTDVVPVPLGEVVALGAAPVAPDSPLVHTARAVGIYLGDVP